MRNDDPMTVSTYLRRMPDGSAVQMPDQRTSAERLPRYTLEQVSGFREKLVQPGRSEHGALAERITS
jgi:hypothetical protein